MKVLLIITFILLNFQLYPQQYQDTSTTTIVLTNFCKSAIKHRELRKDYADYDKVSNKFSRVAVLDLSHMEGYEILSCQHDTLILKTIPISRQDLEYKNITHITEWYTRCKVPQQLSLPIEENKIEELSVIIIKHNSKPYPIFYFKKKKGTYNVFKLMKAEIPKLKN